MDDTRQLLKIFGVSVTDFEAESKNCKRSFLDFPAVPARRISRII